MAARTFRDAEGVEWQAWQVLPGQQLETPTGTARLLPEGMAEGWITFESPSEKRRLYPIPAGWTELSTDQLAALCRSAHPVRPDRLPTAP